MTLRALAPCLVALLAAAPMASAADVPPPEVLPRRIAVVPAFDSLGDAPVDAQLRAGFVALVTLHRLRIIAEPAPEGGGGLGMQPLDQLAAYVLEAKGAPFAAKGDRRLAALVDSPLVERVHPLWNRTHALAPHALLDWGERCDPAQVAAGIERMRGLGGFVVDEPTGLPADRACWAHARWRDAAVHGSLHPALKRLRAIPGARVTPALWALRTRAPSAGSAGSARPRAPVPTFREALRDRVARLQAAAARCPAQPGVVVTFALRLGAEGPPQVEGVQPASVVGTPFEACAQTHIAAPQWPAPPRSTRVNVPLGGPPTP